MGQPLVDAAYCYPACACGGNAPAFRCGDLPACAACAEPCGYAVEAEATEDGWSIVRCGSPAVTNAEPWRCGEHEDES